MKTKKKQTIVILTLLLSLILAPALSPLQVSADLPLKYDNPNAGGTNPYKLSFSAVTPEVLTSVVSCTGAQNLIATKLVAVNDAVKKELDKLLKKAKDELKDLLLSKAKRKAKEEFLEAARQAALATTAVGAGAASATILGSGVPGAAQAILDVLTDVPHEGTTKTELTPEEQKKIDKAAEAQKEADAKKERRERALKCMNGIAVQLAKNQLTSMTKYTMNWVNSGFNGDPMYVQDVNSFMNGLTDQILQKELELFKNPASIIDYPYGREYARGAISAQQAAKDFNASMKQDLTNYLVPGATPQSFATDFSQGGWDGWLALTQHSQNNPLGFNLRQTERVANEQNKAVQQKTDEINRNSGFLDQRKCVEYEDDKDTVHSEREYKALCIYTTGLSAGTAITGRPAWCKIHEALKSGDNTARKCVKYATVTPGSLIKTKTETYLNTGERQLELVKTMDDALNSLFSALLNRFASQGLRSLSSQVNNFTSTTSGGFGINQIFNSNGNSIPTNTYGVGSSSTGGYFDLTRDLGNTYKTGVTIDRRGVLQYQQDFIDKSKKLMGLLPSVLSSIGELDHCIPGPNPEWQTLSQDAISDYIDSINSGTTPVIDLNDLDAMLADYGQGIESTYGSSSPMQDSSSPSYLKMSAAGLSITKDLSVNAEVIASAQDDYKQAVLDTTNNLAKLNTIKVKVNAIIAQAQARRATELKQASLPAIKQSCLDAEKITYVVDGQKK